MQRITESTKWKENVEFLQKKKFCWYSKHDFRI